MIDYTAKVAIMFDNSKHSERNSLLAIKMCAATLSGSRTPNNLYRLIK